MCRFGPIQSIEFDWVLEKFQNLEKIPSKQNLRQYVEYWIYSEGSKPAIDILEERYRGIKPWLNAGASRWLEIESWH